MLAGQLVDNSVREYEQRKRWGYLVGALAALGIQLLQGLFFTRTGNPAALFSFVGAGLCFGMGLLVLLPRLPLHVVNSLAVLLALLWLSRDVQHSLAHGTGVAQNATVDIAILAVLMFTFFSPRISARLVGTVYGLVFLCSLFGPKPSAVEMLPVGLLLLLIGFMSVYSKRLTAHQERTEWLEHLAFDDPLTELQNRHAANVKLQQLNKVTRGNHGAVVLLDMDHFKQINEQVGYLGGDHVLQRVARVLTEELREPDQAFRWSGQEFLLLFYTADKRQAKAVTERILARVHSLQLIDVGPLSLSAGVAQLDETENAQEAVLLADRRLYTAKTTGRNKVVSK